MVRQKAAHRSASHVTSNDGPLLGLPWGMLQQVLGMLDNDDLLVLLQTSKAMAQQVMQHSSGRLELKVQQPQGGSLVAIRRVLQWAPPACLKLMLDSLERDNPGCNWESQDLFGCPPTAYNASGSRQRQQFPCLLEIAMRGFVMPTLVPANLTAACPNLRLLHLHDCKLELQQHTGSSKGGSRVSKQAGSSSSSSSSSSSRQDSICVRGPTRQGTIACTLTLALTNVHAPELQDPPANAWLTRSTQAAADIAELLGASVANVRCLKLRSRSDCADFIWPMLGPQLAELHVEDGYLSVLGRIQLSPYLQQLHKLVMPGMYSISADDMNLLLSLPNLAHVGLGEVGDLNKDYSSHPCKWQSLHLCLNDCEPWLSLDTLARLPIHSLTQPLTIGSMQMTRIEVRLPHNLAGIQRLSQQLTKCGVRVLPTLLSWEPCEGLLETSGFSTADYIPAFEIIASAFGPQSNVQLSGMLINQTVLQAVAAACQDGLQKLTVRFCKFVITDMQPAWHAVLSGCPGLATVVSSWGGLGRTELTAFVRGMMAAMTHQPSGRYINLLAANWNQYFDPYEILHQVRKQLESEGTHEELAGVKLTIIPDRCTWRERLDPCLLITRQ